MITRHYSGDEIRATYDQMQSVARLVTMIDLDAARAVLESMREIDDIMPIIDPTGWMQLRATAPAHQQFAQAFVNFRTVLEEFRPEEEA